MSSPEVDVEDLVIAYLITQNIVSSSNVSTRMPDNVTPPFVLVQRVAGGDDWIVDHATISIHSFANDQTTASDTARSVHHAMRQLRAKTPVTMPDSTVVTPYGPTVVEQTPIFLEWEPTGGGTVLSRYVARYLIAVRLPSITSF